MLSWLFFWNKNSWFCVQWVWGLLNVKLSLTFQWHLAHLSCNPTWKTFYPTPIPWKPINSLHPVWLNHQLSWIDYALVLSKSQWFLSTRVVFSGTVQAQQELTVGLITMQNPAGYGNSTSIEASINSRAQGESAAGLKLIIKILPFITTHIASVNISVDKPANGWVLVFERKCNLFVITHNEEESSNFVDSPINCQTQEPPQPVQPPALHTLHDRHTHTLSVSSFSLDWGIRDQMYVI